MHKFPEAVQFRAPAGFSRSIAEAAEAVRSKPSEFIRQAVADRLAAMSAGASKRDAVR